MPVPRDEGVSIRKALAAALRIDRRYVVAVSGGMDSMVLLEAIAGLDRRIAVTIANFDHRTGPHSARASRLVQRRAAAHRMKCIVGRSTVVSTRESDWRDERWAFLRNLATRIGAEIVTGHTRDDQVETVFMRILRDAGPRGLAALYAESDIVRPFLDLDRASIARFAAANKVQFVDDPSNASRAHLRNRVRLDLLPAINRVRRSFPQELLSLSRNAATWRSNMDDAAEQIGAEVMSNGSIRIARGALSGYDPESLRTLWPAIAALANVVMDRRGTHRLAEFTIKGRTGGSIQLSGGIEVRMFRDYLQLGRWDAGSVEIARSARLGLVRRNAFAPGHA
ncbi:MAG TPA: tRNA lysidine(34) synthetase TilS [Gemmatimonadaceae bacterium]|nr:tRNA lysidine(34) synthetase TilS [Gemmatimonadaceae bacterium]